MFGRPLQLMVLIALGTTAASLSLSAEPGPKFPEASAGRATVIMAWRRGHRRGPHRHRYRHVRRHHGIYGYGVYPWVWCYRFIGWDRYRHKICSDRPYAWPY